jgi:hypothetical protein
MGKTREIKMLSRAQWANKASCKKSCQSLTMNKTPPTPLFAVIDDEISPPGKRDEFN